ncbi:MAG: hypothetical protein M3680_08705 [Myxococcota bacterium]|nr:hypothetical protein [Myxococcota bacterium]
MSSLEQALQRALAVRINLQISLSQLPIVEEWMDIHLDRWLEHNPTPPDMPDGEGITFLAMIGSDLRRIWWGAWGDPRGFVPKLADYFKLCNIAKSDAAVLDQVGEHLEPRLVGSWIGVWGGKVTTGWHFWDPHPWSKVEAMFGTHEAKYQIKKWVEDHRIERVERFTQAIGDNSFSEVELAIPGDTVEQQVTTLSQAFQHFTGAPLERSLEDRFRAITQPQFALALRMRGGQVTRVGALAPGVAMADIEHVCTDAKVPADPKLGKLVSALGEGIARIEYGRAGDRAGVDIYLEPSEPAARTDQAAPTTQAN